MCAMTIVTTTRYGAVRMKRPYCVPSKKSRVCNCVYNRRRRLTADVHVMGAIQAERGTNQAIIFPKLARCATNVTEIFQTKHDTVQKVLKKTDMSKKTKHFAGYR